MSTPLWDFYDGEPFMQNPHLGLLTLPGNPGKRKRGKMAARKRRGRRQPAALRKYWATHRKGRKNSPRRRSRRRARRNWLSPAAIVAANPRRRHRRHRMNPRRRRHYRRNPALLGFVVPPIKSIVFAGVGFAGPSMVQGFLSQMFPTIMQQAASLGIAGKYLVKAGSVLGLAWLTRRFVGRAESHYVLVGGGINVGLSLVHDFAPNLLPANPLAMYVPVSRNLRGYVPVRPGLRQNVPGTMLPARGTFIPNANPFSRREDFGQYGTPARYFRY